MDGETGQRGQSLIEATLGTAILLLLLTSVVGVVAHLKDQLKHDFVDPLPAATTPDARLPAGLPKFLEIVRASRAETVANLERQGWQVKKRVKGSTILILNRDEEKMILTKLLGVKVCSKKSN